MVTIGSQGKLMAVLVGVIVLAGASIGAIVLMQQPSADPSTDVIRKDGTQLSITLTQMQSMDSVEAYGAYENSFDNPRGNGTYKGVRVSGLVDLAGGMESTDLIVVNGSDGYSVTFPYSKVYPSLSTQDIQGDMILAYSYNETIMPEWELGFRIIFLTEDEYYSNADAEASTPEEYFPDAAGPQCVSNVVTIRIVEREPDEFALTIAIGGTTVGYTMTEILALSSTTGEGGYKNRHGTLTGPNNYTGVAIYNLLRWVSNLPESYEISVLTSDGIVPLINQSVVEGTLIGYNSTTGISVGQVNCTMILAYDINGEGLGEDGPLRFAFLNVDEYFTTSTLWIKSVVKITVNAL